MAEKENLTKEKEQDKKPVNADKKPVKEVKEKVPLGVRIKKFFKDYKSEIKKITWPTRQQVVRNTSVVLGVIILVAAIIGVLDLGFTKGIQLLGNLF